MFQLPDFISNYLHLNNVLLNLIHQDYQCESQRSRFGDPLVSLCLFSNSTFTFDSIELQPIKFA